MSAPTIKLNLGSGRSKLPAPWLNIDVDPAMEPDLCCDIRHLPADLPLADEAIAIHVLEHIPFHQGADTVRHWRQHLAPGAHIAIECPSLRAYAADLLDDTLDATTFNKAAYEAGRHKAFLDTRIISAWLEAAGFVRVSSTQPRTHCTTPHLNLRVEADLPQ